MKKLKKKNSLDSITIFNSSIVMAKPFDFIGKCKYDDICKNGRCPRQHGTPDGLSPALKTCMFGRNCTNSKCYSRHPTSDGRSPSRTAERTKPAARPVCMFGRRCTNHECIRLHPTPDGRSPSRTEERTQESVALAPTPPPRAAGSGSVGAEVTHPPSAQMPIDVNGLSRYDLFTLLQTVAAEAIKLNPEGAYEVFNAEFDKYGTMVDGGGANEDELTAEELAKMG